MEINSNLNLSAVDRALPKPVAGTKPAVSDQVSLGGALDLERSLNEVPPQRAEMIERARQLVADSNYPPPETIQKISQLLALNFELDPE